MTKQKRIENTLKKYEKTKKMEFTLKVLRNWATAISPKIEIKPSTYDSDRKEVKVHIVYDGKEMDTSYDFQEAELFLRGLDWGMAKCKTNRKKLVRFVLGKDKAGKYKLNSKLKYPLHPLKFAAKMKV